MNRGKRFISIFTLCLFITTLLPIAAWAASPSAVVNGTPTDGDRSVSVTLRNIGADDAVTVRSSFNTDVGAIVFSSGFTGPRTHTITLKEPLVAGRQYFVDIWDVSAKGHVPRVKIMPVRASSEPPSLAFLEPVVAGDSLVRLQLNNAAENDVVRVYERGRTAPVVEHFLTNAQAKHGSIDLPVKVRSGNYWASINDGGEAYVLAQSARGDFTPASSVVTVDMTQDPFSRYEDVPVSLSLRDRSGRQVRDASAWVYVWAEEVNRPGVSRALYAPEGSADDGLVVLGVTEGRLQNYPLRFDTDGRYVIKASLENPRQVRQPVLFQSNTSTGAYITVGNPEDTGYGMDVSYNGITQGDLREGETASRAVRVIPQGTGTLVEGTLQDRNGNALENARVNLSTDSSRIWLDRARDTTDADGRFAFRVSGDTPGDYRLTVRANGLQVYLPVEVTDVAATPVHTIDLDFEGLAAKNLKDGDRAYENLPVVTRSNGTPVQVTAYDANGYRVGLGERFTISTDSSDIWLDRTAANTDGDGKIDFRVYGDTVGDYEVTLRSGNNTYRLPVQLRLATPGSSVKSALLTIHNNTIITDNVVKDIDTAPVIRDARTFVPYRALAEAFGAQVVWNENARQVTVVDGDNTIVMHIGSQTYSVNGVTREMDVAPYIENSRTMVPVRFIAEAMDFRVDVTYNSDGTTHQVLFTR